MNVLLIASANAKIRQLKNDLKEIGINPKHILPDKVNKIWLTQFHLIYIHPSIPKRKYLKILKKIQKSNWSIPLLIPSPPPQETANSYVVPANITPNELALTIHSFLKRPKYKNNRQKLKYKDITLDIEKRIAKRKNRIEKLRNKEFGILEIMLKSPETIIPRDRFTEALWDRNAMMLSNTLEAHMSNLRNKIDRDFSRKLIHTIPCVGYKLGYED